MKSLSPGSKLIAGLSRRSFFGRAAATGGAVLLGSTIPAKLRADKDHDDQDHDNEDHDGEDRSGLCNFPVPIPHINTPPPGGAHLFFPAPVSGAAAGTDPSGAHPEGRDPSVIFNFKGFVGQGDFNLSGIGTDLTTRQTAPYTFHTDMRFMDGVFIGTDGVQRRGAFVFV